jgi:hypothetical protein
MARSITYRQRDLAAALRAVVATGIKARAVEVDRDGKIVIVLGSDPAETEELTAANEWDNVKL